MDKMKGGWKGNVIDSWIFLWFDKVMVFEGVGLTGDILICNKFPSYYTKYFLLIIGLGTNKNVKWFRVESLNWIACCSSLSLNYAKCDTNMNKSGNMVNVDNVAGHNYCKIYF